MSESTNTTNNAPTNGAAPANDTTPPAGVEAVRTKVTATLSTLIDVGAAWASAGLGYVKLAAESGARALEKTAKTLEVYQERFKKADQKAAA